MMDSTEDTHQYIVVHQATLRNRVCLILIIILSLMTIKLSQLMWLSLTMEGCLISTAAGTVISASFGMNLQSGVHENTYVSSNLLRKMISISLNKLILMSFGTQAFKIANLSMLLMMLAFIIATVFRIWSLR